MKRDEFIKNGIFTIAGLSMLNGCTDSDSPVEPKIHPFLIWEFQHHLIMI